MSEKIEEKISEKLMSTLTPRAFILGLIFCLLGNLINMLGLAFSPIVSVAASLTDRSIITIIIMVILSLLINPLLRAKGFSTGELVLIYVMSMAGVFEEYGWGVIMYQLAAFNSPDFSTYALQYTPDFWMPTNPEIWQPMLSGGAAVPWGAWIAPILYWCIFELVFFGVGMSFGLILTHSVIDVERLPFPYTQVIAPLTNEPKKPARERVNSSLLIAGFIIGFIIQGTYGFFQRVIPAFPDFWPRGLWGTVGYDLGPILGAEVARNQHLVLTLDNLPSMIALFFLMPTKIVGSALLVHFILGNIVPYIEVTMGMISNFSAWGLYDIGGWILTQWGTLIEPTGIQWWVMTGLAFPIGFVIAYVFFVRREILASLRAAIKGDKTSQFSDRLLWIIFVLSIIIYEAMTIGAGIPALTATISLFYTFVFLTLALRMRGEAIMTIPPLTFCNLDTVTLTVPPETQEAWRSTMMIGSVEGQGFMRIPSPVWAPLEGIRLLEMSGKKWSYKGLVIGAVVVTVIGVFFNYISCIWGAYTYGVLVRWHTAVYTSEYATTEFNYGFLEGNYAFGTVPMRVWPELTVGILTAIIITALSQMFIWWPIHPLGLLLGGYLGWGQWFQALIAFILRVAVLKVGGGELYSKFVQIMLGLLIGYAVIQVLYAAVLLLVP